GPLHGALRDHAHRSRHDASSDSARRQRSARADRPADGVLSRAEGSRQGGRARVLPARGPRLHGVLPPARSAAAAARVDRALDTRRRRQEIDRTVTDAPGSGAFPVAAQPATTAEQLTTLFALGREVASVLDLDELLQKIPELIARITKFQAFALYLLDPKRGELSVAYSIGYPEETARTLRRRRRRRRTADSRQRRARRSAVRRGGPGVECRARRSAQAQGPRDRRAESVVRHARSVHRSRRSDAAAVRGAGRRGDRERP